MIVFIDNPETVEKLKKLSITKINQELKPSAEPILRKSFENASVHSTALAVIELAKNMGYDDLASEFENQLKKQLNN